MFDITSIFDYTIIADNIGLYFDGLWITLQLVGMALVFGFMLAVPIGVLRSSRNPAVWGLPWVFIYFFRGTPLLVQIYILYYGFGQFEYIRESFLWPVLKEAYACALIGFTLNNAAYSAEIIRGAIVATPFGEVEAAKACGMSRLLLYRRIILPSAFRRALPMYGNEVIFMLHGSAIASVITIVDLLGAARIVNSDYYAPFEAYLTAGAFYLVVTFAIVFLFKWVEKHWHAYLRPREETATKAKTESATA